MTQFSVRKEFARADQTYFKELLVQVLAQTAALDALIAAQADRSLEQLDAVDRGVLWLALAELKLRPDVPVKVVINEAVDLAKRYGPVSGYRFVNAVLDRAAPALRRAAIGDA